jgi:hypothetical protein
MYTKLWLDEVVDEIIRTVDDTMERDRECDDVEVSESKPSKHEPTDWLSLADSICHDPWRRRP